MNANGAAEPITDVYDQSLAELFLAQVRRHADRPAIAGVDGQLSYAELGSLAERFARGLRHLGLPEGAVVAVAGERGQDFCVAMLGAVCAGLAYAPLDPSLPADRQHRVLTDSGAAAVVQLPGAIVVDGQVLEFADVLDAGRSGADGPTPTPNTAVPVYVMFTSGTTGRPKGVAIPQRGVIRLCIDNGFADVEPTDRVLHAARLSFDISVFEIWATLLNGACLVPVARDVLLSAPALHAVLERERISVVLLTTSIFHNLAAARPELFAGLRYAIVAGEAMRADAARRVLEYGRPAHLINAYGLTEIACFSTAYEVNDVPPDAVCVPIGVPISDTTCYVVRSDGSLTGDGEDGELCLGGGGNATGYVNQPEESAARFVSLPVGPDGEPVAVYRTGDIVRRRADGVLEFVGRNDDQVKIRGFRVEPGEIAAVLTSHSSVADAAVVARGDGDTRVLAAYVVTDGRSTPQDLLDFLRARLPEYLVPATMTVLDRLPLRASGKLDRDALPSPRPVVPRVSHAGPEPNWRDPRQLFLTGATGFLGAYLLRELLDRTDARIHALVRGRDEAHAYGRLAEAQRRYGIHRPLPEHRVCPVLGDRTKLGLGMREADWEREAAPADVIHRCGAEVNFPYPYEKLQAANVFGTQEVLRLAARRAIPVHHVSTMSVVHGMGVAGVRRITEDTGNETTKNATTGDLVAFSRNPDRWHLLRRQPELLDSAVEGILHYTSVIQHVTHAVLRPQTLAGTALYPGDLLCVWVASANRDEEVFTEPDTFRIDPNPHLAFTVGKHFCLGAALSHLELRLVFESLQTRVESIHLFGFPIRKPTNLILAYASVPGRTTGWLIQAKGWLIQLRPTGRDELTE